MAVDLPMLKSDLITLLGAGVCSKRTGTTGDVGMGADTAAIGLAGGAFRRRGILNGTILLLS